MNMCRLCSGLKVVKQINGPDLSQQRVVDCPLCCFKNIDRTSDVECIIPFQDDLEMMLVQDVERISRDAYIKNVDEYFDYKKKERVEQ